MMSSWRGDESCIVPNLRGGWVVEAGDEQIRY